MPFLVSVSFLSTSEPRHVDYKVSGTVHLKNCSALDFHTLKPLISSLRFAEQHYIFVTQI